MQIQKINNVNHNNFKGFERTVYKAGKCATEDNVLHRNNTWFFRKDLQWIKFAEFLKEKYKNIDKINTFVYACSDGREVYSLLMALDANLDAKEVEKFCPIKARDYDIFAINKAKTEFLTIDEVEKERINFFTGNKFDEYFEPTSKIEGKYRPTKKLTDRVIFEVSDFTKDYDKLPQENCVLMVRNCWPYFSMTNQYNLPQKVCNHFNKNATIIIGEFDYESQERRDFLKNGFKSAFATPYGNVFEK